MIRALLWKELRDQAAILIALLTLGCGVIATAATLGSRNNLDAKISDVRAYTNAGRLAVLALAVAAGVVVGGSLFAGERENETFSFLEGLPVRRWTIWRGKIAAGGIMAALASMVLITMGVAVGTLGSVDSRTTWVGFGLMLSLVAFAWGTFGSVICDNTLAACGVGLLLAAAVGSLVFPVTTLLLYSLFDALGLPNVYLKDLPALGGLYAVAVLPLLFSAAMFTQPDRARNRQELFVKATGRRTRVERQPVGALASWRALLWLTWRQSFLLTIIGLGIAIITGVAGQQYMLITWPVASVLAGSFAAVLSWQDESTKGSNRFWGERRIPTLQLWFVKVACSFAQLLLWCLPVIGLVLLREFIHSVTSTNNNRPDIVSSALKIALFATDTKLAIGFILIWPLYGFGIGHLVGMLFRKTIVSAGVAVLVAAPLAAMWLPSFAIGGVHLWYVLPVPLIALMASVSLRRAWATDRIATFRSLTTILLAAVAAVLVTALGLATRAYEVPLVPEADDDLKFAETVPALDSDDGGRLLRQALSSFGQLNGLNPQTAGYNYQMAYMDQPRIASILESGWNDKDTALRELLRRRVKSDWTQPLVEATTKPYGPFLNPRGMIGPSNTNDLHHIHQMLIYWLAHGLMRQGEGDPAAFVAVLDSTLTATINLRTKQIPDFGVHAYSLELLAIQATHHWLRRLEGRPDLLAQVAAILEKHEAARFIDPKEAFLVQRMLIRNSVNSFEQWLPQTLGGFTNLNRADPALEARVEMETNLLGFAAVVPWEKERLHRVIGLGNVQNGPIPPKELLSRFLGMVLGGWYRGGGWQQELPATAQFQLLRTVVALQRFAHDTGKPATALTDLVPKYLPAVPLDPYSTKQPVKYRISRGETIGLELRDIEPGFVTHGWTSLEPHLAVVGGILAANDVPRNGDELPDENEPAMGGAPGMMGGPGGVGIDTSTLDPAWVSLRDSLRHLRSSTVRKSHIAAPGQGIVWSIGPDRRDDGGRFGITRDGVNSPGDIIRWVPVP